MDISQSKGATAVATAAVFLLTALIVAKRLLRSKKHPPSGPLRLPIIGHLHHIKKPLHHSLARISSLHGPLLLLRFGSRPVLLVSSPSFVEECFTKNDVVLANRPALIAAEHFAYNSTAFSVSPYGHHWRTIRRITTLHVFSSARVDALSSVRADEVRSLLRQLFREFDGGCETPRRTDLNSRLKELTLNVMMQIIAGKRYHREGATVGAEEGRRFTRIIDEVFRLSGASTLEDLLPFMRWLGVSRLERRMIEIGREMDQMWQEMIDERRQRLEEERERATTLIDEMLLLQKSDPEYYTDEVIKGTILALITAGTDTSAGSIEWSVALLLNNPEVLTKAITEIEKQVGYEHLVTDADLPNLPYLHNVIKETLRLFPVAPLLLPHKSSTDCTIGGFNVQCGTMILVNAYAMQRDPSLWDEPLKFKPERFEGGDGEGFKFIPFGYGRRRCPGEGLAIRAMALLLGSLIQCFEWERVGVDQVDLTEGEGITMHMAVPLEAMYKPRGAMINVLSQL